MDSPDKMDSGPSSFRKISSEKAGRTYRRHGSDSSPSDDSPKQEKDKNYSSSKSEREIEKSKSHNRSERDYDRHSDDYYKSNNHTKRYDNHAKRYDDNYDYKNRSKDYREKEHDRYRKEETRDRVRKDHYDSREHYNREKGKRDYFERENERKDCHERENEKRKRSENSSSFTHEVKQRESKFSKPENKEKPGSSAPGGTDLNAAKAAAMKAADFVNKNIGGPAGGPLTTEQKKKMLWGNKKNESTQKDITKNWDLNLFADRERQEKFNKLMGVKGQNSAAQKDETEDVKKIEDLETDLEKQYTAGLRRRDGRTVGLGL
ncbi:hypothetical protein LUZ60_014171 [Juncus effusus]|nr:hypothetical protein LUZ60_014171 [Juncus effusus]